MAMKSHVLRISRIVLGILCWLKCGTLAAKLRSDWPMVSHLERPHLNKTPRIFNLGMSRSGSTSVAAYLRCKNLHGYHWSGCRTHQRHSEHGRICAFCVLEALEQGLAIEQKCGDFDFFAEFNFKGRKAHEECIFPAFQLLPTIDEMYPKSKFILPVRSVTDWYESIHSWNEMDKRIDNCLEWMGAWNFTRHMGSKLPITGSSVRQRVTALYTWHITAVKEYFAKRPEALLIFNISDPAAEVKLNTFLGYAPETQPIRSPCWGKFNFEHSHFRFVTEHQSEASKRKNLVEDV